MPQLKFGPTRNIAKLQALLKDLPRGTIRVAVIAFTEYIIGDGSRGLSHDQPYKFASRAKAYGDTGGTFENGNPLPNGYFSAAQFRKVAAITKGFTVFGRKNDPTKASEGYSFKETRGGYGTTITNSEESAYWTRSDKGQARQLGLAGWLKQSVVIANNTAGGLRKAMAEVNRHLKSKGK